MKNILIFATFVFFLAVGHAQSTGPLPPGFMRFNGTDPNLNNTDLRDILDARLGSSPIVVLGESIHGTAEYSKFEFRVIKYLVEEKGFRVLVIENPRLRSEGLTEALSQCGVPLPLNTLYFPYEEDRIQFQWIQDFNCAHPNDQVHFRGVDIWDRYWDLHERIVAAGTQLGIPDIQWFDHVLKNNCVGHNLHNWEEMDKAAAVVEAAGHIEPELYVPCMDALTRLMAFSENAYQQSTSKIEKKHWAQYIQVVNTAYANQEDLNFYYSDFGAEWDARERGQARNVYNTWREFGLDKKVIWVSHTSHASHMRSGSDWWKLGFGLFHSAVYFFESMFHQPVFNMMLTSYEASGAKADFAVPTSSDSMDLFLHSAGEKFVAWDPRSLFVKSQARWWVQNENWIHPQSYRDGVFLVPEDNFDLFFFFDETKKGVPILPWVSPWRW